MHVSDLHDEISDVQRRAAEAELNRILANNGRLPGSWTTDELAAVYIAAGDGSLPTVAAATLDDALGRALAILDTGDRAVTEDDLRVRAAEILNEGTFTVVGRRVENAELAAMLTAVEELGLPGDPFKNGPERAAAAFEPVLAAAVADGRVRESQADTYRVMFKIDPRHAVGIVAALPVAGAHGGFDQLKESGEVLLAGDDGYDLHVRAERLIRAKGWGEIVDGKLSYETKAYMRALEAIDEADRYAREEEAAA